MDGFDMWNDMGRWMWFIAIGSTLTPIVIVLLIVMAVRRGQRDAQKTPLEILEERLANGEISPEEYRARRSALDNPDLG